MNKDAKLADCYSAGAFVLLLIPHESINFHTCTRYLFFFGWKCSLATRQQNAFPIACELVYVCAECEKVEDERGRGKSSDTQRFVEHWSLKMHDN